MKDIIEKLDYQPCGLTQDQITNPLDTITDFYNERHLHAVRSKLWELYSGWIVHLVDFAEGDQNAEMLFFYTQLVELVNAGYVFTQMNKKSVAD